SCLKRVLSRSARTASAGFTRYDRNDSASWTTGSPRTEACGRRVSIASEVRLKNGERSIETPTRRKADEQHQYQQPRQHSMERKDCSGTHLSSARGGAVGAVDHEKRI